MSCLPGIVGHVTAPNAPAPAVPELPPELEIQFQGRALRVKMPTPEQLLVWKRTLRQLQDAEVKLWNAEQVMVALERARRIIDTMLADPADVEWLDDEMLAGTVDLMSAFSVINQTVAAFADAAQAEGNRETRRAAVKAAPAKKATRRKAVT